MRSERISTVTQYVNHKYTAGVNMSLVYAAVFWRKASIHKSSNHRGVVDSYPCSTWRYLLRIHHSCLQGIDGYQGKHSNVSLTIINVCVIAICVASKRRLGRNGRRWHNYKSFLLFSIVRQTHLVPQLDAFSDVITRWKYVCSKKRWNLILPALSKTSWLKRLWKWKNKWETCIGICFAGSRLRFLFQHHLISHYSGHLCPSNTLVAAAKNIIACSGISDCLKLCT